MQQVGLISVRQWLSRGVSSANTTISYLDWAQLWMKPSASYISSAPPLLWVNTPPLRPPNHRLQPVSQLASPLISLLPLQMHSSHSRTGMMAKPSKCKRFLLQCSLYFAYQSGAPISDASKVATVISLLTGACVAVGYCCLRERGGSNQLFQWVYDSFSEPCSTIQLRAGSGAGAFFNSGRVQAPLPNMPSPSAL